VAVSAIWMGPTDFTVVVLSYANRGVKPRMAICTRRRCKQYGRCVKDVMRKAVQDEQDNRA